MAKIDAFFKLMHEQGASDLHLIAGQQPALRIRGEIERVKYQPLENDALKAMLYEITPSIRSRNSKRRGMLISRTRYQTLPVSSNFFQQRLGVAAVFREIPSEILTPGGWAFPP